MTSRQHISRGDLAKRQPGHISLGDVRNEVADVLAEALWTILCRDRVLTTGSRPELAVVGKNAQHIEKARL